jgi:hypothetical protein
MSNKVRVDMNSGCIMNLERGQFGSTIPVFDYND